MIQLDEISVEEKEAIDELKKRTSSELTPRLMKDETLYFRFLKARDFNINNAEALFRKHLNDRKVNEIEAILDNNTLPEYMNKYVPISFMCYDKEGAVVRYTDLGQMDVKGVMSAFERKELLQFAMEYIEKDIERMTNQTKKYGKQISKIVFVINMEKMNSFTVTYKKGLETAYEFFKLFQDCYPERIKTIYCINASFYFNVGFMIFKSILASELLKKIHIYGKTGWQEALLNTIDANELPAFLGGNKTDPDGNPLCETIVSHGKRVPEELYLKHTKKSMVKEDGVKKLMITRLSSSEVLFYIYEPNTYLEWEFETKQRDIAFALYYKDLCQEEPVIEELIPRQRVETTNSTESGVYKCDKVGTYVIEFDNSHSWLHSKEIYYRVRLTKPGNDQFQAN